jgi:hypothetical protein
VFKAATKVIGETFVFVGNVQFALLLLATVITGLSLFFVAKERKQFALS